MINKFIYPWLFFELFLCQYQMYLNPILTNWKSPSNVIVHVAYLRMLQILLWFFVINQLTVNQSNSFFKKAVSSLIHGIMSRFKTEYNLFFQVKQPMFGANYVKGDVISEPDGMFLRQNPPGNWVISICSGQKPCTRII